MIARPAQGEWPAFVQRATADVRTAYAYALEHRGALQVIPCFCGCGEAGDSDRPHRSNYDCFVRVSRRSGTVLLDEHASKCGVCIGIALDTKGLIGSGKTLREVRAAIDARWSGFGAGTTPYPD